MSAYNFWIVGDSTKNLEAETGIRAWRCLVGFGLLFVLGFVFSVSGALADRTVIAPETAYEKWAWDFCLCKFGNISSIKLTESRRKFTCYTTPAIMSRPPHDCQKTLQQRPEKIVAELLSKAQHPRDGTGEKPSPKATGSVSNSKVVRSGDVATGGLEKCVKRHFRQPLDKEMMFCQRDGYLFGRGTIRHSTSARLELSILNAGSTIDTVYLQSTGGVMSQGVQMGRLIREAGLNTGVTGFCASACLHAYLGGIRRFKTATAKIGDHRALFLGEQELDDVEERRALIQKSLMSYWAAMGVNPDAVKVTWKTSSFGVHWFRDRELKLWKISTDFAIRKPVPGPQANTPPESAGLGFGMTCRHMEEFAAQWNKTGANKWVDNGTRALPIRVECARRSLVLHAYVKLKSPQISRQSHTRTVRSNVCRNKFIREQMAFGWRFAHQLDFADRRSRTIDVRCEIEGAKNSDQAKPKEKADRVRSTVRKTAKKTRKKRRRKIRSRKKTKPVAPKKPIARTVFQERMDVFR